MKHNKDVATEVTTLPLMELFPTLQGEGAHTGEPAVFIRLGGCDVGCVWCDVKESWPAHAHPQATVQDMVAQAAAHTSRLAVITGGEPLMYDLTRLTDALQAAGFRTHVETSGAHSLSGSWDWVTFSPKKFKKPLPEVAQAANELKVVVYNRHDLDWAQQWAEQVGPDCLLYLQPEWDKRQTVLPLVTDFIQQHPQWRLSLQTHKYIGLP